MELDNYLKDAVGRVHGAIAAVIFGSDGIAVSHCAGGGLTDPSAFGAAGVANPAAVSAGLADLLRMFDDVSSELLGSGKLREITLTADSFTYVVSRINHEYAVAIVLKSDAASGKAKIVLRRAVNDIRKVF
ncbi:MAG: hypothetical protein HZA20_05455 [Nitrospirae bacterium]|nr:hypothetical protein [Nitrospirota bacterium]